VGPYFDKAGTRIGRNRLPAGYVAVLDDPRRLAGVLTELLSYALAEPAAARPRIGVVFRKVSVADKETLQRSLMREFGADAILDKSELFGLDETYHLAADSEAVSHAWARHSDSTAEERRGQLPVTAADLQQLPDVMRTGNIKSFEQIKGMPRIVFEKSGRTGTFIAVAEIQRSRRWLVLKTFYKRK
jgi:hypothetical protein